MHTCPGLFLWTQNATLVTKNSLRLESYLLCAILLVLCPRIHCSLLNEAIVLECSSALKMFCFSVKCHWTHSSSHGALLCHLHLCSKIILTILHQFVPLWNKCASKTELTSPPGSVSHLASDKRWRVIEEENHDWPFVSTCVYIYGQPLPAPDTQQSSKSI